MNSALVALLVPLIMISAAIVICILVARDERRARAEQVEPWTMPKGLTFEDQKWIRTHLELTDLPERQAVRALTNAPHTPTLVRSYTRPSQTGVAWQVDQSLDSAYGCAPAPYGQWR